MEKDKRFTNIQEETIYGFSQIESEEETNKKISNFFSELVERRRDDPLEGGLQAGVVIFPDKCAMKICENDGLASHTNAFINLVKYLNGDHKYISTIGSGYFGLYLKEHSQLLENGIEVRILDGKQELMLAITSNSEIKSQYQFEVLSRLLLFCKTLKDNKTYDSVRIGLYTPVDEVDFNDLSDEHYENMLNIINNSKYKHNSSK